MIEQRARNRIIEYFELAAFFAAQREYERAVPLAHVPYEVINQWADCVPRDPRTVLDFSEVYTAEEVEALRTFHVVWTRPPMQFLTTTHLRPDGGRSVRIGEPARSSVDARRRVLGMTGVEIVLDAGPIPYDQIALYGDPDLEQGLRDAGFEPQATAYRLIEIPLAAIGDIRSMSHWKNMSRTYVDNVRAGVEFAPIVVMSTPSGWTLLDGVNRTHAYWVLGRKTVRAYDLIAGNARP